MAFLTNQILTRTQHPRGFTPLELGGEGHGDIRDKDGDCRDGMGQEWGHGDRMGTLGMDIGMGWGHGNGLEA